MDQEKHTNGTAAIHINVVCDCVCPWCFVAKRRMDQAIKAFPGVRFEVDWEPYLLDCTVDEQGRAILQKAVCQDDLMCLKYGEHGQQMIQALDKICEACEIHLEHARPAIFDTVPSHCLLQYAKSHGKQSQVVDGVMRAYFEDGLDISNVDVLVAIAESEGLNGAEARSCMCGEKCRALIREHSKSIGERVKSIPTFIISRMDRRDMLLKLTGARTVADFEEAFKQILTVPPLAPLPS